MGGRLPASAIRRLFPERPVKGTAQWVQLVNAVSIQEDYVKSLERKLDDPDVKVPSAFVENLLVIARKRLLELQNTFKEIDEGG